MATDASLFAAPPIKRTRKYGFFLEEEEIVVNPSTELIPDEYEHCVNDVLVHIFRTSNEEELAQDILTSFQHVSYEIDAEKNLHCLNTRHEFEIDLETIKKESADKRALFLVFIGFFDENSANDGDGTLLLMSERKKNSKAVHVREIWNAFAANKCPELREKPKIFIFCTSPKPHVGDQVDSLRRPLAARRENGFDFPVESDMLIVYQKVDDTSSQSKEEFLHQLSRNVRTFSKKHDIVDLVSYIHDSPKFAPLTLISTLTRKFYLTPNNERDHSMSVVENHSKLLESLIKIKEDIQKIHDDLKKKQEKKFSLRASFGFKKKGDGKPKIKNTTKQPERHEANRSGVVGASLCENWREYYEPLYS